MNETIIKTRCVLHIALSLLEDGNVEVTSQTWDKKNAIGRQNFLLTRKERFALLSFLFEELEKHAAEEHEPASVEVASELVEDRQPRALLGSTSTRTILPSVPAQSDAWR